VIGLQRLVFYCPLCGVAWERPPDGRIDEVNALETLAPDGVLLPTEAEVESSGFDAFPVSYDWFESLQEILSRRQSKPHNGK
jgi:hypothetical protein